MLCAGIGGNMAAAQVMRQGIATEPDLVEPVFANFGALQK